MICYKERNLSFCTLYGVQGDDFYLKFSNLKKKFVFSFCFVTFNFLMLYCSINLKRQSEHSGLRPDTSDLVNNWGSTYSTHKNFGKQTCKKLLYQRWMRRKREKRFNLGWLDRKINLFNINYILCIPGVSVRKFNKLSRHQTFGTTESSFNNKCLYLHSSKIFK